MQPDDIPVTLHASVKQLTEIFTAFVTHWEMQCEERWRKAAQPHAHEAAVITS
jgi:hypothetical protein